MKKKGKQKNEDRNSRQIYCLFNNVVNISGYRASNNWMTVSNELEGSVRSIILEIIPEFAWRD
jgi:hypothetical protein